MGKTDRLIMKVIEWGENNCFFFYFTFFHLADLFFQQLARLGVLLKNSDLMFLIQLFSLGRQSLKMPAGTHKLKI